jgi:cation diffusion facilitator CzcD-associated flavoprotein CzcO
MFQSIPFTQRLVRYLTYWRRELMVLGFVKDPSRMTKAETIANEHLARQVSDPALLVKLTPQYRLGCKRVTISNDFYPALVRENVKLVNEPITRVSARGVHTSDGVLHEVDVIIAASGFMVTDHPIGERVRGAHGQSLADAFEVTSPTTRGPHSPTSPTCSC